MKALLCILLFSFVSMYGESNRNFNSPSDIVYSQEDKKSLHVDFPTEPEIFSEAGELRGQKVSFTFSTSSTDSGVYALISFELGELEELVKDEPSDFFNGFVSYLIYDLGAELGAFTDFEHEGYKGNDFSIISPNSEPEMNTTSKGKTLLIKDHAYIWFAISNGTDSLESVNQFLNSYSIQ